MKSLENIFAIIEKNDISIDDYHEGKDNKLCGYELNTYTGGSVNQIIFLDFRNHTNNPALDKDPKDVDDFISVLEDRINDIDIDDEIESNRQDPSYKAAFTMRAAVEDFEEWKQKLDNMVAEIKAL